MPVFWGAIVSYFSKLIRFICLVESMSNFLLLHVSNLSEMPVVYIIENVSILPGVMAKMFRIQLIHSRTNF